MQHILTHKWLNRSTASDIQYEITIVAYQQQAERTLVVRLQFNDMTCMTRTQQQHCGLGLNKYITDVT